MVFEVGKYFRLTRDVTPSKKGIYVIDNVLYDHFPEWCSTRSPSPCISRIERKAKTWVFSHNIESNRKCEFAVGSLMSSHCYPFLRNYNLDRLLGND